MKKYSLYGAKYYKWGEPREGSFCEQFAVMTMLLRFDAIKKMITKERGNVGGALN